MADVIHRELGVKLVDHTSLDAFQRLRVSNPLTVFDSQNEYDTGPLVWEDLTANGGSVTHLPNEASVRLRITTTANSSSVRQSRRYFRYQPGKSQLALLTAVIGAAQTNVTKRLGYFDASNGIFFQQDADGTLRWVRRTFTSGGVVDNTVAQSAWNIDKFDGTGPSRVTLDITKAQILVIDLQWLGVGRVRVGFDVNGRIYPAHEFLNANSLTLVYMTTANLPLRYEIAATGAAGAQTDLIQICSAVVSEGGFETERAYAFTANNGVTSIGVTTRRAILSLRPASTLNGIAFRGEILPIDFSLLCGTNNAFIEIVYNPTFTGTPTWTAVDATNSGGEFSVHGDAAAGAITGGVVIASFYVNAGSGSVREVQQNLLKAKFPLVRDAAGANPRALSVVATALAGTSSLNAAVNWTEVR